VTSGREVATPVLFVLLFVLLFAVYLASYSGAFHSVDELPIVAVTQNLVQRGAFDINQLVWAQDTMPNTQGAYGRDGNLYSKRGVGLSLAIAPLYWLAQRLPGLGAAQAAMLTSAVITALTSVLVFLYVVELDYGQGAGLLASLAYGLGTIAWVYARYLFAEPLVALGLMGTAYFLLRSRREVPGISRRSGTWVFLAGAALALAMATRVESLMALPFYLAYLAWPVQAAPPGGADSRHLAASMTGRGKARLALIVTFLLPLGLTGLGLGGYNWVRFGGLLETGYSAELFFSTPLHVGLAGFLFSPGRSLFLYCPIALAGLGGMPLLLKAHRREGALALALPCAFLLLYSMWHSWHGGWTWGPRLLLPVLPFIVLPIAPLWRLLQARPAPWGGLALLALASLSCAAQVPGVAVDFSRYLQDLTLAGVGAWEPILDPQYSPLIGHLRLLWQGALDLIWVRGGEVQWPLLLPALGLVGVASIALCLEARTKRVPPLVAAILLVLGAGASWWTLRWGYLREDFTDVVVDVDIINHIETLARPQDVLILDLQPFSPVSETTSFFLNHYHGSVPYYTWIRTGDPRGGDVRRREETLQVISQRYERVWLALPATPQGDPASATERWFAGHAFKVGHTWLGGSTRLCLYSLPGAGQPALHPLTANLGPGILLRGYRLGVRSPRHNDPARAGIIPGDTLQLTLLWRSEVDVHLDLVVFVQLLGGDGRMLVGIDRRPVDDFRPTLSWRAGEEIADNYGLPLPGELPPGVYRLIVGLYHAETRQRVPLVDRNGAVVGDAVTLGEIAVSSSAGQ
jgi:hypothetical protein